MKLLKKSYNFVTKINFNDFLFVFLIIKVQFLHYNDICFILFFISLFLSLKDYKPKKI